MSVHAILGTAYLMLVTGVFAQSEGAQPGVVISADRMKLFHGEKMLLDGAVDGLMAIHSVRYSPNRESFLVIGCGYECNDNVGFLFKAGGTDKRKFTERWDYILQDKAEWSANGEKLFYYRINSSGAEPPAKAPAPGWIEIDIKTGRKSPAVNRRLKTSSTYSVFRVLSDDVLNMRAAPGVKSAVVGTLPHDAKGIKITGTDKKVGRDVWVPVKHQNLSGWVNQSYLSEEFAQDELQSQL
jgi:hypothetical protein